jgi:hypothetical protein
MNWWRKLLHRHKWAKGALTPTGYAALSWGLSPTREYSRRLECQCGASKDDPGYVIWRDHMTNPEAYDANGWPLTEDGKRMPCAP